MRLALAVLSLGALAGCGRTLPAPAPAASTAGVAAPSSELEAVAARADPAFAALQQTLSRRLMAELGRGGPSAAITVCRDEAQALTTQIAAERGFPLGRTSHRVRNPANAPPAWAAELVRAGEGQRAAEARRHVVDLGDSVGVLAPIATGPVCLSCHGASVDPAVAETVKAAYPEDRATGFSEGALRGWFWAVLPKS